MYIQVALDNASQNYDRLYTYAVGDGISVSPGMWVSVPFGAGNRSRIGLVLSMSDETDFDINNIKPITSVLDRTPIISEELITLILWVKERYFCTYWDAVHCILPPALMYKVNYEYTLSDRDFSSHDLSEIQQALCAYAMNRKLTTAVLKKSFNLDDNSSVVTDLISMGIITRQEKYVRKTGDASQKMIAVEPGFSGILTPRQEEIVNLLNEFGSLSVKELLYFTGASDSVIKKLADKGAVSLYDEEVYRKPAVKAERIIQHDTLVLNDEQQTAYEGLLSLYMTGSFNTSLLYGVTGSGKTSVYIKMIEKVIESGRQIIVLVPEISLTSQTVQSLKNNFGDDAVAVLHSGLSSGERCDEWKRCRDGKVKILVGTRSAVFAPFTNLGLIVIDEEHEHTYKSEMSPRYDAKEVALYRCKKNNALLILASATPAVSSVVKAEQKIYRFFSLKTRFGSAQLPEVKLIDMVNETLSGNTGILAEETRKSLIDNYKQKKQSIVLINRRGYHTYVRCIKCRTVVTCPNCSISLTYHYDNNRLMCHYCGYSVPFSSICPSCGADGVSASGLGTQKAEIIIQDLIPEAKILRIDTDSVARKYSLDRKLDEFASGDYDIMVGTQMVSKGLNFENVTLVCVLNIDQLLYSDDYKSNERTYELLTQVVGRAGRGKFPGKAIIQTENPGNVYIQCASEQNYSRFYKIEKSYRKMMLYPPYSDILMCVFISEDENSAELSSNIFLHLFSQTAESETYLSLPIRAFVPTRANIYKIGNKYRYKIIIKCKNNFKMRSLIHETLEKFYSKKGNKNVSVFVDMNSEAVY